jgi:hypothetical protein
VTKPGKDDGNRDPGPSRNNGVGSGNAGAAEPPPPPSFQEDWSLFAGLPRMFPLAAVADNEGGSGGR